MADTGVDPQGRQPLSDLVATAESLWGGSGSSPFRLDRYGAESTSPAFGLVPNARSPRLLVPLAPPKAAASAVRRFSTATSLREAGLRVLASAGVRFAPGRILRDRISTPVGSAGLAEHLSEVIGTSVTFSVGIGNARVNRKPVLQVFDSDRGVTVAFAKVGDSEVSRRDVAAEGRALAQLNGRDWRTLRIPRLISQTEWNGMQILLMSALRVPPIQRPWGRWEPPLAAMSELSAAFSAPDAVLAESAWVGRQRRLGELIRDKVLRVRFQRCLDEVCDRSAETVLPFSCWHGDWTAWNMGRARGKVLLWDWERFETDVPSGLDRLHYHVNAITVRAGVSVAAYRRGVARAFGGAARSGSGQQMRGCVYLLAVAGRYLSLIDTARGGDIAGQAGHVLTALEQELSIGSGQ